MFPTVAFRLAYDALKRWGVNTPAWFTCESGTVAGANAEPGRDTGPVGLRLTAGGSGMISDTANAQDRMGGLCPSFHCQQERGEAMSHFVAAGRVDALVVGMRE